jgi:phosphatidylglycerol lysyltransferase
MTRSATPVSTFTRTYGGAAAPAGPHFRLAPSPAYRERTIADMAFQYGQVYDSCLTAEPTRREFWSADRSGVLSYARIGRHVKVGGGLLAPSESRARLLAEFLERCRAENWTASFFTITPTDVELFRAAGCEVAKWGEDPIVDLPDWHCRGKEFEWLRRQENYCRRQGLVCREWDSATATQAERRATFAEIENVSQAWLAAKPQAKPLGFFNGEPTPEGLLRRRIFLVHADEGSSHDKPPFETSRLEAFVAASAFDSGRQYGIDLYRQRPDAVRGAVPFAMLQALRTLQAEDVASVSLCMVATLGCGVVGERATLLNRLLNWSGRCLNPLFDLPGMHHYKSRFRPRFEPRYVCMWPRASLMNSLTNFYLAGITNFSARKLIGRAWRQWRNKQRRTLVPFE